MIIKSHIRGGFRNAAAYLKEQGLNEKACLCSMSDPQVKDLDEAFRAMWAVSDGSKVKKPIHHISINPTKGEYLTDKQVMAIVEKCEEAYGYKLFHHQRVIVEHIKDGRQHFHVMWNRVSLETGKAVYPGFHWKKSKEVAREMEVKLGLKKPEKRKKKKSSTRKANETQTKGATKSTTTQTTRKAAIKPTLTQIKGNIPTIKTTKERKQNPAPFRPAEQKKGWPEAAIMDWAAWGHLFPRRFFIKWPELANH
ncbi:MAG: relaxase/mobilization nuclease domain-containing protein [Alphaproteobacteria bacterium]|nr:relaxase/mobilization nuclease domain-containing protein [Alphaproteobacteria bacterium]MCL2504815.1 relaxase/mobilization nuclease domain-containing protein [Alphaproteobacteria bacterium]